MYHCNNETVKVYSGENTDPSALLTEMAEIVKGQEGFVNVSIQYQLDGSGVYEGLLYIHG